MPEMSPTRHWNIPKKPTQPHQNNTETSPKKAETRPRHHRDITKTTPRHHWDTTETSLRHHRDHSKALRKQDRDITMTPLKQHQDVTETSPWHPRDISKASQKQDRHITETRPRHDRKHEFFNLEAFPVDIRVTASLVCPKVHNIQIQIGIWDFA